MKCVMDLKDAEAKAAALVDEGKKSGGERPTPKRVAFGGLAPRAQFILSGDLLVKAGTGMARSGPNAWNLTQDCFATIEPGAMCLPPPAVFGVGPVDKAGPEWDGVEVNRAASREEDTPEGESVRRRDV